MKIFLIGFMSLWITVAAWGAQKTVAPQQVLPQQEEVSLPPSEQDMFFRVKLLNGEEIVVQKGPVQANEKRELQITVPGEKELHIRTASVTGGTTFCETHSADGRVVVIATELLVGEERVFAYDRQQKIIILTGLPKECPIRRVCLSSDYRHYALITDGEEQVLGVVGVRKGDQESNMVIAERGVWMPLWLEDKVALEKDVVFAENDRAVFFAYHPGQSQQNKAAHAKLYRYLKVVDCAVIKADVIGAKLVPTKGEGQDADFWKQGEHRITQEFRKKGRSFEASNFICTEKNLFFLECSDLTHDGKGVVYQYNFKQQVFKARDLSASQLSMSDIRQWDQELFIKPECNALNSPAASPQKQSAFFPKLESLPKSFFRRKRGYFFVAGAAVAVGIAWSIYRYRTGAWRELMPTFYRPRTLAGL